MRDPIPIVLNLLRNPDLIPVDYRLVQIQYIVQPPVLDLPSYLFTKILTESGRQR
jgi:hypothetical protein